MRRRLVSIAMLALCGGCAATPPRPDTWRLPSPARFEGEIPARFRDEPAVALLREEWIDYVLVDGRPRTRFRHHERRLIRDESGLDAVEKSVVLRRGEHLLMLQARTISPDGVVHEVARADIYELAGRARGGTGVAASMRVFRFPAVEPGSVVEWAYSTELPEVETSITRRVAPEVPVLSYQLEVTAEFLFELQMAAFNLENAVVRTRVMDFRESPRSPHANERAEPPGVAPKPHLLDSKLSIDHAPYRPPPIVLRSAVFSKDVRDGKMHASLALGDVPGPPREPHAPPSVLSAVAWTLAVTRYTDHDNREGTTLTYSAAPTWADLARRIRPALEAHAAASAIGFQPDLDLRDCKGKRACIAGRAVAFVRDRTVLIDDHEVKGRRTLGEALASGVATADERAQMLVQILRRAGVSAEYALASPLENPAVMPHPSADLFVDDLLVYLPLQRELPAPLWIDPACDHCEPGQLPWARRRGLALALDLAGSHLEAGNGEPSAPVAPDPPPDLRRVDYQIALRLDGAAEVTATEELRGAAASEARSARHRESTAAQDRASALAFVRTRFAGGVLVDHTPLDCAPAKARCTRRIRFTLPGYAVPSEGRLIVPLTMLHASWDAAFLSPARIAGVFYEDSDASAEVATFTLPAGWKLAAPVAPLQIDDGLTVVRFQVDEVPGRLTVRRFIEARRGHYRPDAYETARRSVLQFGALRARALVLVPCDRAGGTCEGA